MHRAWITTKRARKRKVARARITSYNDPSGDNRRRRRGRSGEEMEIEGRRWESRRWGHHKLSLICCARSHLLPWPGLTGTSRLGIWLRYIYISFSSMAWSSLSQSLSSVLAPRPCEGQHVVAPKSERQASGHKADRLGFACVCNALHSLNNQQPKCR